MDGAPEHHLVHLGGHHHEALQHHAKGKPQKRPQNGKQHNLAEDVGVHLPRREAEHLQGGDLAGALGDVDVREVVQHDEGERRGGHHEHHHDHVHRLQHLAIGVDHLVVVGHRIHSTGGPQRLGEGRALGGIIGGTGVHGQVRRLLAEGALVGGRGHEGVVADIVLDDAGHGHRVGGGSSVAQIVLLGEGDGIARRKPQLHRELLGNDRPLGRQRHRLAACALAEVPQVLESRGILGGHDGGHGLGAVGALGDHGGLRLSPCCSPPTRRTARR